MQCAHCDVEHAPVNLLKGRSGQEDARDAVTWTVACTVALWSSCCFMDYTFESESALSLSLSGSFSPSLFLSLIHSNAHESSCVCNAQNQCLPACHEVWYLGTLGGWNAVPKLELQVPVLVLNF